MRLSAQCILCWIFLIGLLHGWPSALQGQVARPQLPANTLPPVVLPFDPTGTIPLGILSVAGKNLSQLDIRQMLSSAPGGLTLTVAVADQRTGAKSAPQEIRIPGLVMPSMQSELRAKVTGFIQKVNVEIGQRVKKDEILGELALPEMEQELRQKDAMISQARAQIQQADSAVAAAQAQMKATEATAAYRKKVYERLKKNELSQSVADEARLSLDAAEADHKQSVAKRQCADADLTATKARLEIVMSDRDRLATLLEYGKIRAPFDSVITQRRADPGSLVGPIRGARTDLLFVLTQIDPVRVVVQVPENEAQYVHKGTPAVVQIPSLKDVEFKGQVSRTAGVLDPRTHTLRAEIDLPNREGKLLPGMSTNVQLAVPQQETRHEPGEMGSAKQPTSPSVPIDNHFWIDNANGNQYFVQVPHAPFLIIELDRKKAADFGLSLQDVIAQVREKLQATNAAGTNQKDKVSLGQMLKITIILYPDNPKSTTR